MLEKRISRIIESSPVITNENQIQILVQLAQRRNDVQTNSLVSKDELFEETAFDDRSAFESALADLVGTFVTETEAGVRLRAAGEKFHEALLGLSYTQSDTRMDSVVDSECPICDEPMTAVYEAGDLTYRCPDHGEIAQMPVPSVVAERAPLDEVESVANLRTRQRLEVAQLGSCWNCWDEMTAVFPVGPPEQSPVEADTAPPLARYECERCGTQFGAMLSQCLAVSPVVRAFLYERGTDLDSVPLMAVNSVIDIVSVTEPDDETNDVEVVLAEDGEHLHLALDDCASVVEARIEPEEAVERADD